ncbi:translational GTPase TypA [Candidatus Microgenomates bacterium]|nr:translational GTPase TypA [Candidatus Microgenomates bacterium]
MNIRNVAIIAHVDHGKTTLVDALLTQSKTKLKKYTAATLIMDSNELEQERGITIFSKNASVVWQDTKINIIDTPGHADFGGEVERVLTMADGCLLLIDAKEGPMPQTRFVLKKALEMKHKIIVVVNKIDRPDARINYVLDKTLDLFLELGADDETADFPIVYASAKVGKAGFADKLSEMTDISPVFEAILEHVPAPSGNNETPLQMLVTNITRDLHRGRIAIGRIYNGTMSAGQEVMYINRQGVQNKYKLTSLMTFEGLERVETTWGETGDIVAISGISDITIGETIADVTNPIALPLLDIEEPTMKMTFMANSSPFAGLEGEFKTARQIRERLYKELETDMALKVVDDARGGWEASGRGELHLAILIERMRREGYEFQVESPQVIEKQTADGILTPYERVLIEVPEEFSGIVMQKMGSRHGELQDMKSENGLVTMEFVIATRSFFRYRSEFMTDTHGLGVINASFYQFGKGGESYNREQGSLVAHESGLTNAYGLTNAQDRGLLFIGPGVPVYKGQVVGRHARSGDLRVNVCKTKQLTNHRSKGEGVTEYFKTPHVMDLEEALEYIADDELVEVTPKNIRIRKKILDEMEERRKRSQGLMSREKVDMVNLI